MTNQQWRPEHASLITPYLTVRDAEAAAQFYTAAFGFERANVCLLYTSDAADE